MKSAEVDYNVGLIIIGYQGIGKSSVSTATDRIIDLDSSFFYVDKTRDDNWYKIYCAQAVSLAKAGYIVCVSSHKVVQNELATYDRDGFDIWIIYPSLDLEDKWVAKLHERYFETNSDKDWRAYNDAYINYSYSINTLKHNKHFENVCLETMDYDLRFILDTIHRLVCIETQLNKLERS